MAVKRSVNWISQQRADVPDMRTLESATRNDFDELIKSFVTGTDQGYILRGFEISMSGAIGGAASGLQMIVDPGAVFHINSSESGTFYLVPSGTSSQQLNSATNTIVDGAFTPSAINYVGLEYERYVDDTTSAQTYIWNPTTNSETVKTVPRAQVLRYRLKITTSTFASNVLPIATVTTDSGNNVVSITDARWMLFRLGLGGASPDPFYIYPWTEHSEGRIENPSTSTSNSINPFHGGDKMLMSMKEWMDAIMSAIQEIKGTTYWYSLGTAGSIASLREDLANTVTTGKGSVSHSPDTAGLINWDEDIYIKVIGSRLNYKISSNAATTDITLLDDQVAYINLIRGVAVAPNLVFTNGSAIITSVGSVSWTSSLQAGDWVKLSADADSEYYQILTVDSLSQVTLTENYVGSSTGSGGAKARYAFGTYQTSAAPSSNRDIYVDYRKNVPSGQDVFWLMMRSDNGGVIPRVYIRFLGVELEQGETEQVSDTTSTQLLQYIGAPLESSSKPQYVSALNPGSVREITDIQCGDASTVASNQYFYIYSSGTTRTYHVWVNKDGGGTDPAPLANSIAVEWPVTTGQTADDLASSLATALSNTTTPDFSAAVKASPNTDTVRVTLTSAGDTADASNYSIGAPFNITVVQQGTGTGNSIINDDDNLTLAIKKLDKAIGDLLSSLDDPSYDETVDIVASGATPPTSLNGPIISGTNISLPNNSRLSGAVQKYTVGKGSLQVYLNGQYLRLDTDWSEVGSALSASNEIQILQDLAIGDVLEFRISAGGAGSGGGGIGPAGPAGPTGPAGADAAGGPVSISTKTADYTVLTSDTALLADCTAGNVTFTFPSAASAASQIFYFKKKDASANSMILAAADLIDDLSSQSTNIQYESFTVFCDGTTYWIF